MGADKLWIDLWGRPAWRWSLDALLAVSELAPIAVVAPEDQLDRYRAGLPPGSQDRCLVVTGGDDRIDSVLAGLGALSGAGLTDEALVLVHDAARPAASPELAHRVLAAARAVGAAVPSLTVRDTLRRSRDESGAVWAADPVDRTGLLAAQTPQAARLGALRAALERARDAGESPTDDAAALIAAGVKVAVVEGDATNIKLTEPTDEVLVNAVLRGRAAPVKVDPSARGEAGLRVGFGFDAHRFDAARRMRLGGLDWPDAAAGLAGHSDGDAVLHAVVDALLGAAGLGDIGSHFPSTETRWEGADSAGFVETTIEQLRQAGWRPSWLDVTVVGATPQIARRRGELAGRLATLIAVEPGAVTVKGTTSDGLGFGGEEGLAAYVVAIITPA
jgi:2-C-methyl-D-erythritol 4-phosphate cytidylyltransferase/2-C-methyl-D-erythritol 2,4-cyclodiphosphate synthase